MPKVVQTIIDANLIISQKEPNSNSFSEKSSGNVTKERRALPEEDVEAFFEEDKRSEGTSSTAAAGQRAI